MKIELSTDDYKIIYSYVIAQESNPCNTCPTDVKYACCGCEEHKSFTTTYKTVIDNFKSLQKQSPSVVDDIAQKLTNYQSTETKFVEAFCAYRDCLKVLESDKDLYDFVITLMHRVPFI